MDFEASQVESPSLNEETKSNAENGNLIEKGDFETEGFEHANFVNLIRPWRLLSALGRVRRGPGSSKARSGALQGVSKKSV